jgi:trehalose-phosphatase
LSDIEKRVGLTDVIYAGNHGLEWNIEGRVHRHEIPENAMAAFEMARRSLLQYAKLFPALILEDNCYALSIGYRTLSTAQAAHFRIGAIEILDSYVRAREIRVMDNLFTFEIMPMSEWTKGSCAQHIYEVTRKGSAVAIYIGDSLTDEDAFRVFAKSGITFRVGRSDTSLAQYYFKSRNGVNRFLHDISIETNPERT